MKKTAPSAVILCSFSGAAADLPPRMRTPGHVLAALRKSPLVSTFDMCEVPWLRGCIDVLKVQGKIIEDNNEQYPWHRYIVVEEEQEVGK